MAEIHSTSLSTQEQTYTPYLMREDGSSQPLPGGLTYSIALRMAMVEIGVYPECIGFAIRED
jgi:hypothetical protein